jgi:hypothetical protein
LSEMYALSVVENFYLNKAELVDRSMTMVGRVKVKVGKIRCLISVQLTTGSYIALPSN